MYRATPHDAPALARRIRSNLDRSGKPAAAAGLAPSDRRAPRRAAPARSCGQSAQQLAQPSHHIRGRPHAVRRPHQQIERTQTFLLQSKGFTNASLDAVAIGRGGRVFARDQDAEPRLTVGAAPEVKGIAGQSATLSFAQQPLELRFAPQPARCIEAETLLCCRYNGYNPRRRRPRARRLRSTARPPRVLLRTRKPWRLARRVLDGW